MGKNLFRLPALCYGILFCFLIYLKSNTSYHFDVMQTDSNLNSLARSMMTDTASDGSRPSDDLGFNKDGVAVSNLNDIPRDRSMEMRAFDMMTGVTNISTDVTATDRIC